jgi:predicted nucleotidyltransferase component of viral defense system
MALKGGTALNLFLLDVPRLSVDIDLNYTGAADREVMLEERPKIEQALSAVCGRMGIQVRRTPEDHAGGKWRLSYTSVTGRSAGLEVDVNYLLRTPLWPLHLLDSRTLASFKATEVPLLDVHELAAGKLAALFARSASRDLFDARELLASELLDSARLRLAFVVYGGINRRDWRAISLDDVRMDPAEADRQLLPLLRPHLSPSRSELASWTRRLVADCRELLSIVLPLGSEEISFLNRLNERGEIIPEHLTPDATLAERIRQHPALRWKAINVRRHHGHASDV